MMRRGRAADHPPSTPATPLPNHFLRPSRAESPSAARTASAATAGNNSRPWLVASICRIQRSRKARTVRLQTRSSHISGRTERSFSETLP